MFAQNVVERLGHQGLQAAALAASQCMHGKGHFRAEEAGDLLAALAARRRCGLCRDGRGGCCGGSRYRRRGTAQVGEAGFAAHAEAFLIVDLRGAGKPTCRHVHV